ncbi:MAG TPA: hypothetical protein GX509_08245 [Firmicutes bacterium]|nr:hypothetical protein [Bacillota bacterium]
MGNSIVSDVAVRTGAPPDGRSVAGDGDTVPPDATLLQVASDGEEHPLPDSAASPRGVSTPQDYRARWDETTITRKVAPDREHRNTEYTGLGSL